MNYSLCHYKEIMSKKPEGGGGTPIHYLYRYVPPKGVVILKLILKLILGRDKIDHRSREKAKKLNMNPEQIIILAHTSPSLLLDDAESF